MEKLKIVVGGYIGLFPTGGATWDYMQYVLGLQLLGHDVYYIEDTMQYPVFQVEGKAWNDATACVDYLKSVMEGAGLGHKWAYRDVASGHTYGLTEAQIRDACREADVFMNLSCSTFLRDEYLNIPRRMLVDTDPMFTHIQYALELQSETEAVNWSTKHMVENHNYLFTFAENIGADNCLIPQFGFRWRTTRHPICLPLWENTQEATDGSFTTIMNWSGRKKLHYRNGEWGQKDVVFEKFRELPAKVANVSFKVVVNPPLNDDSGFSREGLQQLGWNVLSPQQVIANAADYKKFICKSFAEFSVAKETYIKSNSGWFSGRSACYLAAGKPVITHETEWSQYIPAGTGLLAFRDMDEAVAGIASVLSEPGKHRKAAREIAGEYFDSNKVLGEMLQQLG